MIRKTFLALALSAGMAALLASPARAGMIPDVANPGDGASPLMQQAQFYVPLPIPGVEVGLPFFFGGHDYCWYDDGWQGAGWYWCGYGSRQGYGWGGGEGFNGWHEHRYEHDWHPHEGHGDWHHHEGHGPGPGPGPHPGPGPKPHIEEHHHP
jgi:hypothetical protein